MKKYIFTILMFLFAASCAFSQEVPQKEKSKEKKESRKSIRKQKQLDAVAGCLNSDSFVIVIDKIRPSFAHNVDKQSYYGYTGQSLKLEGGKVSVNFLYIGQLPEAMMGDQNISIYTKEQPVTFTKNKDKNGINTIYYFKLKNESGTLENTVWEVFVEIQPNGETHITIQSFGMNPMIYQGYLDI